MRHLGLWNSGWLELNLRFFDVYVCRVAVCAISVGESVQLLTSVSVCDDQRRLPFRAFGD